MGDFEKRKKDEVDALVAQIGGLKSKLDDMTAKMDDLKGKKDSSLATDTEVLDNEKTILDLKKQIAQLEADKKKKEDEARAAAAIVEEKKLAKMREDQLRSFSQSSAMAQPSFAQGFRSQAEKQNSDAANSADRDKAARAQGVGHFANEGGRSPASVGAVTAAGGPGSAQIVLKAIGSQASPDSAIVYMTANELQHYPYRLSNNASSIDIEKMLERNLGSSIILGESEQIVPIIENGQLALDETGKIKYKRIKISLVKNDKERKQQIDREISSLADLKKEDQLKRDLIRYNEMKKALQINKK